MATLIIHRQQLSPSDSQRFQQLTGQYPTAVNQHFRIELNDVPSDQQLTQWRTLTECDINLIPDGFDASQVKLILSDMDSTLINIECIDEIGAYLGIKDKISQITEAAMRGEMDFEQSFTQRVALLAGTPAAALEAVYQHRLQLNEGAEELIEQAHAKEIKFALVSGGFTFFTERLKARLKLDFARANPLEIDHNQQVSGRVISTIIGAEAKRAYLHELCDLLNIGTEQTIAVGDGANDLRMMQDAGLSIAYHAKPTVQATADVILNHRGLDAILDFLA